MLRPLSRVTVLAASLVALAAPGAARATVVILGPGDDVEAALNALQPGDELGLRGGTYTLTDAWHLTMVGTAQAPIRVRAYQAERPHLHRPAADQNIIDFDRAAYVEIRELEFSGGSAGLRFIDANFVTIENCEIHDTADVALSANSGSDYQGLKILHNHIHNTGGTGEGMYIGCNNNGCRVHDSVFAWNWIHDTKGPTVSQGDGIEIKEGSYANVVSDNVIHDTGYPCIITYSTVGNGGPNVIERNLLWNCGDHGIQSAADAIIRNNIILGAAANGIANQPHQSGTPSNLQILNNTILAPQNDAIASTGITGSVIIANNAVYARQGNAIRVAGDLTAVTVTGNVGVGTLSGVTSGLAAGSLAADFVAASFSGVPPNDVFPRVGSHLIGAADPLRAVAVMDDFNGVMRAGSLDVGAYRADTNPGAPLGDGFKVAVGAADGGAPADAGGGTGLDGAAVDAAPGADAGVPHVFTSSGCGCRASPGPRGGGWAGLALATILARRARRMGARAPQTGKRKRR